MDLGGRDYYSRDFYFSCIVTMGLPYQPILWNKNKKIYDKFLGTGVIVCLLCFVGFQWLLYPDITTETIIIRATATTAILLLHLILMIGPLTRIDKRYLPLLYNRRHMGVTMFLLAFVHGLFSIMQFHAKGDVHALVSVFTSNQNYMAVSAFPFQILGFFALIILLLMAATSHDFWLKNLSPRIWKSLHMLVYVAYLLTFAHVALGTLQYEDHPVYWILLIAGFLTICSLHLTVGWQEWKKLRSQKIGLATAGYYPVVSVHEIGEHEANVFFIKDQNIAIFKYDGKVAAVSNICTHLMGPLGEGKIVDGCITCPWHGYQYLPESGQSTSPFHADLPMYRVKVIEDQVWVNPIPLTAGTFAEPAQTN